MGIIRKAIESLMGTSETFKPAGDATDVAVDYFNRVDDREQIRTSVKKLYGQGIRKEKDPNKAKGSLEVYTKEGFTTQVNNEMVETLSVGFGNKIVAAHATLFTEKGNKYTLVHDTEGKDVEPAEALLKKNRVNGGHKTTMARADKLSIEVGSSLVLQTFKNLHVDYQHLKPNQLRPFFNSVIEEDGKTRATNQEDLEDATYIVIQLGQIDVDLYNYLAIFGTSGDYPNGRWVSYQAKNTIEVPPVGSADAIEFEMRDSEGNPLLDSEGKGLGPVNPLSWYANEHPDEDWPEYPVTVIYSSLTESGTVAPVSNALHETCLEFSRAASHILSKSQEGAAGTRAVTNDFEAAAMPLPETTTGNVSLQAGQSIENIPHDSASITVAIDTFEKLSIHTGAGWMVPDYMVISADHTLDASSGVALDVKTRPLKKFREFRVDDNTAGVLKIFRVDQVLIALFSDAEDSDVDLLLECTETWDAGVLVMPVNKKEEMERLALARKDGVIDSIAEIREYHQFSSDAEAIEEYEKMAERAKEYPPLNQPDEKPKLGLLRGQKGVVK